MSNVYNRGTAINLVGTYPTATAGGQLTIDVNEDTTYVDNLTLSKVGQ